MQKYSISKHGKNPWFPIAVIVMGLLLSSIMALSTAVACEETELCDSRITLSANELHLGTALEVSGYIPHNGTTMVTLRYTQPNEVVVTRNVTVDEQVFCDRFVPEILGCWTVQALWYDGEELLHDSLVKSFCVYESQTMLECTVAPRSITLGSTITITGYIDPAAPEIPILLKIRHNCEDWAQLATVYTTPSGEFSYDWTPELDGEFIIKAYFCGSDGLKSAVSELNTVYVATVTQEGNETDLLCESPDILSLESNSTVSDLLFDSEHAVLSFTVTGPNQTTGYVQVMVAKELMPTITGLVVNIDGTDTEYHASETEDAWLITISYSHSSHAVQMLLSASTLSLSHIIAIIGSVIALTVLLFTWLKQFIQTRLFE